MIPGGTQWRGAKGNTLDCPQKQSSNKHYLSGLSLPKLLNYWSLLFMYSESLHFGEAVCYTIFIRTYQESPAWSELATVCQVEQGVCKYLVLPCSNPGLDFRTCVRSKGEWQGLIPWVDELGWREEMPLQITRDRNSPGEFVGGYWSYSWAGINMTILRNNFQSNMPFLSPFHFAWFLHLFVYSRGRACHNECGGQRITCWESVLFYHMGLGFSGSGTWQQVPFTSEGSQ